MSVGRFAHERVERGHAGPQARDLVVRLEAFGGLAGGRSLEHAADFDGVADVFDAELVGDESAGRPGLEEALLG